MKLWFTVAILALAGCEQAQWKGWVYPIRGNLTDHIPIGSYVSLEECRASAKNILARLRASGESIGDYECGYRCEADGGLGGLNVCEKTEK